MDRRRLGNQGLEVSAEGLGCMGMTWAYGSGDVDSGLATIDRALELGVTLLDTAGIRATDDPIESEGVARALRRGRDADLILWLTENESVEEPGEFSGRRVAFVRTKIDLRARDDISPAGRQNWFEVSAVTGEGIDKLLAEVGRIASEELEGPGSALLTRERHRAAFRGAEAALIRALGHMASDAALIAEELRMAADSLGRVAGRVEIDEVLGEVFSRLCVGK